MARAKEVEGKLRGCPTCGTKVAEADLRLRDFSWVNEALPGRLGGMDVDFVLSQYKTKRVLHIEMKPPGAPVSTGARMTYALYVQLGLDAWVAWGPDAEGKVIRGTFDRNGQVEGLRELATEEFAEDVAAWWQCGLEDC